MSTVGKFPEGLAISPKGNLAVSIQAEGSNQPKTVFYHHAGGSVAVLAIDGDKVTKIGSVTVGALPEARRLQPDGSYLYVGNFIDGDLSILKVDGSQRDRHRPAPQAAGPSRRRCAAGPQ